ncbi:MAG: NUDIX hydrolase [Bacteroidales bacterium]
MKHCYDYPRPAVTADCLIFRQQKTIWEVLLIERLHEPFKGCWAFPGGFINMDETIEDAAARELFEETGLQHVRLEQFRTFSKPDRDPRGRTISVVFTGIITSDDIVIKAGDDAASAKWFPLSAIPTLAFDHAEMFDLAIAHLKQKGAW